MDADVTLGNFIVFAFWATLVVLVIYVMVRVASVAHFRTKLEYLRTLMKQGEVNAEEE